MANHEADESMSSIEDGWNYLDQTLTEELEIAGDNMQEEEEIPAESALDEVDEYVDDSYSDILNDKINPSPSELAIADAIGEEVMDETEVEMKENTTNLEDDFITEELEKDLADDLLQDGDLDDMAALDEMFAELSEEMDMNNVPIDELDEILNTDDDAMSLEAFDALVGVTEEEELPVQEELFALEEETEEIEKIEKPKKTSDIFSDSLGAVSSLEDEELENQFNSLLPDMEEVTVAEKPDSLMKRMFANIEPENPEEEIAAVKAAEEKKAEDKQRKEQEKQKKKEEKQKAASEKKEAKAAAKDAKAKAKAELKEQKRKEKEELEKNYVPEGKINKIGASIVFSAAAVAGIVIITGSLTGPKKLVINTAEFDATIGRFAQAHEELSGLNLKGSDKELYSKVETIMFMQKQQTSYNNFKELGMEVEALDSLLKGLERYEEYYDQAKEYGVTAEYDAMKKEIVAALKQSYQLNETSAKELINLKDAASYTKSLTQICSK